MDDELRIPEDISVLSLEEAIELADKIREAGRTIKGSDASNVEKVEALEPLSAALGQVTEHIAQLEAAAAELADKVDSLGAAFGDEGEDEGDAEAGEEEEEGEDEGDAEEGEADEDAEEDSEAEAEEEGEDEGEDSDDAAQAAADTQATGGDPSSTAANDIRRRFNLSQFSAKQTDEQTEEEIVTHRAEELTIQASAQARTAEQGTTMTPTEIMRELAAANSSQVAQDYRGVFAQQKVWDVDPRDAVFGNDAADNSRKIKEFAAANEWVSYGTEDAVLAAGGFCGPEEIRREIPDCYVSGTPVWDVLRKVPVSTGSYRFRRAVDITKFLNPALSDLGIDPANTTGIAEVTEAQDASIDELDITTWKPCVRLDCVDEETCDVTAITACVKYGKFQEFSDPEAVEAGLRAFDVALDAYREAWTLRKIKSEIAAGDQYAYDTTVGGMGLTYGLYEAVTELVALAESEGRVDPGSLTLIIPPGMLRHAVLDAKLRGFKTSEENVAAELRDLGVARIVQARDLASDSTNPYVAPANLNLEIHSARTWDLYLIDTDAFVLGTGLTIDMGIQRSPELARQNDSQWFREQFVSLCKTGCEKGYFLELTGCANGARPGLVTPIACA